MYYPKNIITIKIDTFKNKLVALDQKRALGAANLSWFYGVALNYPFFKF